jgi:hypothetical protein
MRTLSLKCILCLVFCLTILKISLKNMYWFTKLVNYINSDVLGMVCTPYLLLIRHLILMHFMKSQFSWQYFMSDLEFFLLSSFFPSSVGLTNLCFSVEFENLTFNIVITLKYVTVEMKWKLIFHKIIFKLMGNVYEPFLQNRKFYEI